jgi:glycerol-3-phosphate acyltransferase PlsX
MFAGMLKQALPDAVGRSEVKQLFKFLDYAEYGGAPLLGVKGVAIIGHGASPARAIMHTVRVATQMVESHLSQDIGAEFAEGEAVV